MKCVHPHFADVNAERNVCLQARQGVLDESFLHEKREFRKADNMPTAVLLLTVWISRSLQMVQKQKHKTRL